MKTVPVTVRYVDRDSRTYREAENANLDSGWMRLSKWNPRTRKYEDMHVIDALNITQVEVMEHGIVKRIMLGLGRRPLS